jgi:predicted RNA binding protein with dsRBD fold (UPF0201 family)
VRQIPDAVRALVADLNLTEQVVDDLVIPQVAEFNSLVSSDALGINFSDQEIEDTARSVFAADWKGSCSVRSTRSRLISPVTPTVSRWCCGLMAGS